MMYVYKTRMLNNLKELSDIAYQEIVWMNAGDIAGESISYTEATCGIYDDALVGDVLPEENEIIFDLRVTKALRELDEITNGVSEHGRETLEFIHSPEMAIIRQKAAEVLTLIQQSAMKGNTVRFVEPGDALL